MNGQDNGLTLEGLAQRLETLERENAQLRHEVSVMGGSQQTRASEVPASKKLGAEFEGRVRRRDLLSKAGAAAVAAVAAGTLLNTREAKAHDLGAGIAAGNFETHWIVADNHLTSLPALNATAFTDSANVGAVDSKNHGSGPGVRGIADALSASGVEGIATGSNGKGVEGTGRYGV